MTRKKTFVPEMLILDCSEDGLSPVQIEVFKKANREMIEFKRKLEIINQSNNKNGSSPTVVDVALPNTSQQQPILVQNGKPHSNIMVLEQTPQVHLVVGSGTSTQQKTITAAKNSVVRLPATTTTTNRPKVLTAPRPSPNNNTVVLRTVPTKFPTTAVVTTTSPATSSISVPKIQVKPQITEPLASSGSPTNNNNTSGRLVTSTSNDVVDLTEDDHQETENASDQKEIAIGKVSEKTFPSLVVNVKVFLRSKEISLATASSERVLLDGRVKRVLMLTATTFTEWLLQQGLLRCEQVCLVHKGPNGRNNSLKLGMYSDATKFPYSGGYIWISECCPTTSVSVFSGSLFEGAPHSPTILLKLIYHWACQTNVQNVLQWVKVDNLYVKNMYTNLRAVCTAAVHEKYGKLGGKNRKVEVGVISLGTTTQDGQMKHIKVEVLGVLETRTKRLRLKALEPIPDTDRQFMKKKFMKILEPLQQWVDKESIIVTDYTVDKLTCQKMGFNNIIQNSHNSNSSPNSQMTNQTIMEYLRKVIPKMFQNTLSLLSRQIIQQFLDELVWRETWGPIPSRAFDTIIQHISEQTTLDTGGTLVNRLSRIALNPLKNWKYDQWAANCASPPSSGNCMPLSADGMNSDRSRSPGPEAFQLNSETMVTPVLTSAPAALSHTNTSNHSNTGEGQMVEAAMIALEPYYYGTLIGSPEYTMERYNYTFQCVLCKFGFRSVAKLTDHLILHAFNKNVAVESISKELCKLCLKICPKTNNHNLSTHRIQVHSDRQTCRTLCKICSVKHKDAASLQAHMIATHCELDMPYHCEICNYRTSMLDSIHHHFNNAHGKGTKGYCPYCLKVMQFADMNGKSLENNQLRFVLHIQKHQLTVNRKCEKCLLNFTNRSLLKDHQDNYHQSCKSMEEVERYVHECTLMAAPLIDPLPSSTSAVESTYRGTLKLSLDSINAFCCECDGNITPDHFVGHLLCSKCKFQTCCNFSMKEHNALMHGNTLLHLRPPIIGRAPVMNKPLYCLCGYSTRMGSHMANHLCECGYYTCYTSKRKIEEIEIKKEEGTLTATVSSSSSSNSSTSSSSSINDVRIKDDVVIMTAVDKGNKESSPTSAGTAASCSSSSSNLAVKEENMKMSVDVEEVDDAMECDDDLLDSMTVDDSSTEAMILD